MNLCQTPSFSGCSSLCLPPLTSSRSYNGVCAFSQAVRYPGATPISISAVIRKRRMSDQFLFQLYGGEPPPSITPALLWKLLIFNKHSLFKWYCPKHLLWCPQTLAGFLKLIIIITIKNHRSLCFVPETHIYSIVCRRATERRAMEKHIFSIAQFRSRNSHPI